MVAERENIQVTEEKELLQQRTQGSRNEMEIVFDAVSCNESFTPVSGSVSTLKYCVFPKSCIRSSFSAIGQIFPLCLILPHLL